MRKVLRVRAIVDLIISVVRRCTVHGWFFDKTKNFIKISLSGELWRWFEKNIQQVFFLCPAGLVYTWYLTSCTTCTGPMKQKYGQFIKKLPNPAEAVRLANGEAKTCL